LTTTSASTDSPSTTFLSTTRASSTRCSNKDAEGVDPSTVTAADRAQGKPVTIGADDSAEQALRTMADHEVRRLPVIDGHTLVGMVSQADVARSLPPESVGEVLRAISD
jgi:CBS domain-containing protein